eukprot:SAG22_NODE_3612_length_1616_cov_1.926170_1_plen_78_part_10
MPGSTGVYAIGDCAETYAAEPCKALHFGCASTVFLSKTVPFLAVCLPSANLVNDPGFEATELPLTPGFLTCDEEAAYG